jgi:hypothetical protein
MISRLLHGLLQRFVGRSRSHAKLVVRRRRLTLEPLESRRLLTLVGITPGFPLIQANDSYSYSGPATGSSPPAFVANDFVIGATPLTFQVNGSTAPVAVTNGQLKIDVLVDNSGNLTGGHGTPYDFVLTGTISGTSYSGTLLEGNVLQFGSLYTGTSSSTFDFRFQAVQNGDALDPIFVGKDIGVRMITDRSNTFTGNFGVAFGGNAKVSIGPISPLPTAIYGYKFDDLNDNGVDDAEPRLNNWTINLTGTDVLGNAVSLTTTTQDSSVNGNVGEYSFTGLQPGTYTVTEVQQTGTGWVQTTGGTTITLTSGQEAVAYSGEEGTLPSGGTEVVTSPLAFGNFHPSAVVIGMDKSPATPKTVTAVSSLTGAPSPTVLTPYGSSFLGGVRVATGNVSGTGFDDIVTAPGRTGQPIINVYDQAGNLLTSFQAYPSSVNGGLQVAVADLNGDGLGDIITVPSWGPAEVRVFMNTGTVGAPQFSSTPTMDFLAFPSSFIGGAVVAASSEGTTPDHTPQIIVGSGAGMKATVEVFDFSTTSPTAPPLVSSFTPFSTITPPLQGGVSLSVAQLTSDPTQSIVVGAGSGGQSLVNIWGWSSSTSSYASLSSAGVAGFPAFSGSSANSPIEVATLNNYQGIATAIVAVQNAGGTTNQVSQLNITGVSPLVLSSPVALPGSFAGPDTIAVINNVLPGTIPVFTAASAATSAVKTTTATTGTVVAAPSLSVADASVSVGSTAGNAVFTVTLSAASKYTVTALYSTADGTAKAGTDYTAVSGAIFFLPGQTSTTITVPLAAMTAAGQAGKTFQLNLSLPANATLSRGAATCTIVDSLASAVVAAPSLSVADVSTSVGSTSGKAVFTVTLSAASKNTITALYSTADGTAKAGMDYTAASGAIFFLPGQTSTTITVPLAAMTAAGQAGKTFQLNLSLPANATLSRGVATGTIVDSLTSTVVAAPSLSIADVSTSVGSTSGNAVFTVTLSAASKYTVTALYSTADGTAKAGTDYTAASGAIFFLPGQTSTTISVPLAAITAAGQAGKTFQLNLSLPANATLSRGAATCTIVDAL